MVYCNMRARPLLLATVVGLLAACEQAPVPSPAPRAEFIIAAADSVFWVRSDEDGIRVRGEVLEERLLEAREPEEVVLLAHALDGLPVLRYDVSGFRVSRTYP